MKKLIVFFFIFTLFFTVACNGREDELRADEKKFKEEYESINGKKRGESTIMPISIADHNRMKYIDSDEVIRILEGKSGVIYFGFPQCPWCRNIVPVLIDAGEEADLDVIYYANLSSERDKKERKDGEIVTIEEGSQKYKKIIQHLREHLGVYEGLEDDTIFRLYFPTVLFVKNGKVESVHIGTVDSHKDPYKALTSKQEKELKNIYRKGITKVQSLTCDTNKTCQMLKRQNVVLLQSTEKFCGVLL